MSFLWRWFATVIVRPKLLLRAIREQLNDDILTEIFLRPEIDFEDILRISLASRRFRILVMPTIFGKQTWTPWRVKCHPFPPQSLWPHIRVFILQGARDGCLLDSARREFLVSHLEPAVRNMTAAHTFVLTNIGGGIWPRLLETITAAPALTHLVLDDSPWFGKDRDIFDLPPTLEMPPLRSLAYIVPHAMAPSGSPFWATAKRPLHRLESEVKNTCAILRASRSSLEALTLPGELILRSLNSSLGWNSLRELYTEGYWPDPADISLLSILLMMPNLRIASLRFHPSYRGESFYVVPSAPAGLFLPHLQRLEIASLLPGDHLLSVLPSGLENLAVIEYPPPPDLYRHPQNILSASAFLDALRGVYLPAVTHLELWYVTDASDERFLRYLPHTFPSLRYLEMRRFIGPGMDDTWNPGSILQDVLWELKHLRVFAFEPDAPERRNRRPPRCITHKYARYIRRLKAIAEEFVLLAPWLDRIQMYVGIDDESFWKQWDVVAVPGETVRLRPVGLEEYLPEIHAIMEEGPVEAAEDSDSE
ncbi:hypothetical protein DFH07DRAFT_863415 [Mycena maculata]|uniref:F-box domain-containing protein n=1 Tax=Mycena maculata TaxID=230809 RepID=A0AAD7H7N7_9AGAR|nr:hypothetical protein DFH07DRAFT_863415 [Mycena maculata]